MSYGIVRTGLGSIDNWIQFWRSKAWNDITGVANLLTKQNLAIEVGVMGWQDLTV